MSMRLRCLVNSLSRPHCRQESGLEAGEGWGEGRRLGKYKFRRQVRVGDYIIDLLCQHKKLIVELDGGQYFA